MSKLSEAVIARLQQAKDAGLHLKMGDVKRVIEEEENRLKTKKTKTESAMSDEEWVVSLEQEPHLQGINIRREVAACHFWCKNNKRQATRRTIINWLNKAERIFTLKAHGASYATGMKIPAEDGPEGWKDWLETNMPDDEHDAYSQLKSAYNCQKFIYMPKSWQTKCREELETIKNS